jgi:hypothetical protein
MIDMAMLIMENKPDPNGNTIPRNIQEGSATFASAKDLHSPMTLVVDGGIYNVTTATCGCSYVTCCGINQDELVPYPMYCPIGQTMQCSAQGVDCNGNTVGLGPGSWSSSNTSVMTVDSSGNVTGHAVGQATINYTGPYLVDATGTFCLPQPTCPSAYPVLQSTATVQVPTSLSVLSDTKVINMNYVSGCTNSGSWGILIAIHYQVLDQNNLSISSFMMEPQEKDPDLGLTNWGDIGPSNYPGTSKFTDGNGQFWDAPLGVCSNSGPFTESDTQYISILLKGTSYSVNGGAVRTNAWSTTSSFPGHGSITNNGDISKSR